MVLKTRGPHGGSQLFGELSKGLDVGRSGAAASPIT